MKYRNVTAQELAALQAFAACFGRTWKDKLGAVYWYNARIWLDANGSETHGNALHVLRNSLGPNWLATFKLPKGAAK